MSESPNISEKIPFFLTSIILAVILFSCTNPKPRDPEFKRIKYNNDNIVVDLGVGLWAWPLPTDYDNDGDNDLLVSCPDKPYNGIYFFENTEGNVKSPIFKPGVRISKSHRNLQPSYIDKKTRYLIPGKEILNLSTQEIVDIYPRENIHTEGNNIRANQWKYCDYNGNGVQDLIVSIGDWTEYGWDNAFDENGIWKQGPLHGYIYLIKNNGSDTKPKYETPEVIFAGNSPIDVYGMPSANFEDFDNDGDLDIICGEFLDKFSYFENIGTRTKPIYTDGKYLKYSNQIIKMDLEMIIPVAIDWDRDGDIDLVVGQEDGRVAIIANTGLLNDERIPQFELPEFFKQQADEVKFGALVTPFSVDWDNDGDEDIIAGNTAGYIGFVENLSGGANPNWAEPVYLKSNNEIIHIQAGYNGSVQGPCEAKWGYTTLSVGDWDNDGLHDIIINSIWGKVLWYKNIGSINNPVLSEAKPIEVEWENEVPKPDWYWWQPEGKNLVTQWRTTPFMFDWNEDGNNDLIMLDHKGYLAFFERVKIDDELKLLPGKRIFYNEHDELLQLNKKVDGGSGRRKFTIVDWDSDGKLDILVNSKNINFYKNISLGNGKIKFKDMGLLSDQLLAGHSTSPTTVDWDKDGKPELLVGAEDGFFYLYNKKVADK